MLGWSADYPDPDNFISPFFNQANAVGFGWDSPEMTALIQQGQSAPDEAARVDTYHQIEQLLYDEVPAMPLVNPRTLNAVRSNIEGFYPNPLGSGVPFATITKN